MSGVPTAPSGAFTPGGQPQQPRASVADGVNPAAPQGDGIFQGETNSRGERMRGTLTYHTTNNVYTGEFMNDLPHGEGEMKYASGAVFKGTFSAGKRLHGRTVYADGTVYVGQYNQPVPGAPTDPNADYEQGEGTWTWGEQSRARQTRGAVQFSGISIAGSPSEGCETYAPDWAWVEYRGCFRQNTWDGQGTLFTQFFDPAFQHPAAIATHGLPSYRFRPGVWMRAPQLKGIQRLLGRQVLLPQEQPQGHAPQGQQPHQGRSHAGYLSSGPQPTYHHAPHSSQPPNSQSGQFPTVSTSASAGQTSSPITLERLLIAAAPWGFPTVITGQFAQGGLKEGEIQSIDCSLYRGSCSDFRPQPPPVSPLAPGQLPVTPPPHDPVFFIRAGKGELISNVQNREALFTLLSQKLTAAATAQLSHPGPAAGDDSAQGAQAIDAPFTSTEITNVIQTYRKFVTGFHQLIKFSGEFRQNALYRGSAEYVSGDTFVGTFSGGAYPQQGTYTVNATGEVYEGALEKGLVRVGQGRTKFPNGVVYEGLYTATPPNGSQTELKYAVDESELVEPVESDSPLKGYPVNGQLRFGYGHKWAGALYQGDVDARHMPHGVGKMQFKAGLATDASGNVIQLPTFDIDRSGGRPPMVLPTGEVFDFNSNKAINVGEVKVQQPIPEANQPGMPSLPDLIDRFECWQEYEGQFDHGRRKHGVMVYMDMQRYTGGFDEHHRKHGPGHWVHAPQWRNDPRGIDISFKGDYEHGRRLHGTVTKSTGETYTGFFDLKSQLFSGPGKLTLPRHKLVFQGAFMDGVALNGEITYDEPVTSLAVVQPGAVGGYPLAMHGAIKYSGPVDESFMPHGRGEMFYSVEHQQKTLPSSQQTRFVRRYFGAWYHGERHGGGKLLFNTGSILEGLFVKGECPFGKIRLNTGDCYLGDLDNEFNFHGRGVLVFNWKNSAVSANADSSQSKDEKSKPVFNPGRLEAPKEVAVDLTAAPATAPLATNRVAFEGVFVRGRCARGITTYRCGAQLHGEFFDFATGTVLPFGLQPPQPGTQLPPVRLPRMKKPARALPKAQKHRASNELAEGESSDSDSDEETYSAPPVIGSAPVPEESADEVHVPAATITTAAAIQALRDAWIRRDNARRRLFQVAKEKRESAAAIAKAAADASAAAIAAVAEIEREQAAVSEAARAASEQREKKYDNTSHISIHRVTEPTIDDLPEDAPYLEIVKRLMEDTITLPENNFFVPDDDEVNDVKTTEKKEVPDQSTITVGENEDARQPELAGAGQTDAQLANASEGSAGIEAATPKDGASKLPPRVTVCPLPITDKRSPLNSELLEAGPEVLDAEGFEPFLLVLGDGTRYLHRPSNAIAPGSAEYASFIKELSRDWVSHTAFADKLPSQEEANSQLSWMPSGASSFFLGVLANILDACVVDTEKAESTLRTLRDQGYWPTMRQLRRPDLPDEVCHALFGSQKEGELAAFLALIRNSRLTTDKMIAACAQIVSLLSLDETAHAKCCERFGPRFKAPSAEGAQHPFKQSLDETLRAFCAGLVEDAKARVQLQYVLGALFDKASMSWASIPVVLQPVFATYAAEAQLKMEDDPKGNEYCLPSFDPIPGLPPIDNSLAVLSRSVLQHEEDMLALIRDSPHFRSATSAYTEACNAYAEFDRWRLSVSEAIRQLDDSFIELLLRKSARSKQHFARFVASQLAWLRRERMEPLVRAASQLPALAEQYRARAEEYIKFRDSVEGPYRHNLAESITNALKKLRELNELAKVADTKLLQVAAIQAFPLAQQVDQWYAQRSQFRESATRELRAIELQDAISRRDMPTIKALLRERFTPAPNPKTIENEFVDPTWTNSRGVDALQLAVQLAQVATVRMIIDLIRVVSAAKLNLPAPAWISDTTITAVPSGVANPYQGDHQQLRTAVVKALSRANDMQETYLFEALVEGKDDLHVECARVLVEAGASLTQPTDAQGRTVVHILCHRARVKRVAIAIALGYPVRTEPLARDGKSSLHFAAMAGCADSTLILLKSGSTRINHQDVEGDTPLHLARDSNLALLLIENGARMKAKNRRGMRPLESSGLQSNTTVLGQAKNAERAFSQRPTRPVLGSALISETSSIWQPDAAAETCTECSEKFTFFNRRHHCRLCGLIYCSDCSTHRVCTQEALAVARNEIDKVKETHRVCDGCSNMIELANATLPEAVRDINARPVVVDADLAGAVAPSTQEAGAAPSASPLLQASLAPSAVPAANIVAAASPSAFSLPPVELPFFTDDSSTQPDTNGCQIQQISSASVGAEDRDTKQSPSPADSAAAASADVDASANTNVTDDQTIKQDFDESK